MNKHIISKQNYVSSFGTARLATAESIIDSTDNSLFSMKDTTSKDEIIFVETIPAPLQGK